MKLIKSTTKNINFVKDLESHDELIFSGDVQYLFEKLKSKRLFDLVVTSPPYNIGKEYESAKTLDEYFKNQKEVIKAQKQRGMELFQVREGDTGSSAVQVIALTTRIQQIQTHLREHKKDKHSKRGLDALYVRRRKLLDYMERKDFESYRKVVKTLGLIH